MRLFTSLLAALAICLYSAAASADVITACVKPNGGMRIVTPGTECRGDETPLAWNVQGPQGPQGQPGMDGMDGGPGPEGPPGSSLRVFDALGAEIGLLMDRVGTRGDLQVFLESVEVVIWLTPGGDLLDRGADQIFWNELDCQGQAFIERRYVGDLSGPLGAAGPLFVGRRVPSIDLVEYQSRDPGAGCANDQASGPLTDAIPADAITLAELGLTFPLRAPLYVAPAPAP